MTGNIHNSEPLLLAPGTQPFTHTINSQCSPTDFSYTKLVHFFSDYNKPRLRVCQYLYGILGKIQERTRGTSGPIDTLHYVRMAECYDLTGFRVEDESRIKAVLKEALSATRPALVEVMLDPGDMGLGVPGLPI